MCANGAARMNFARNNFPLRICIQGSGKPVSPNRNGLYPKMNHKIAPLLCFLEKRFQILQIVMMVNRHPHIVHRGRWDQRNSTICVCRAGQCMPINGSIGQFPGNFSDSGIICRNTAIFIRRILIIPLMCFWFLGYNAKLMPGHSRPPPRIDHCDNDGKISG